MPFNKGIFILFHLNSNVPSSRANSNYSRFDNFDWDLIYQSIFYEPLIQIARGRFMDKS